MEDWTKRGTTGHHSTTRAEQGGAPNQTKPAVKFQGQPTPDALGSGRRTRRRLLRFVTGFFDFSATSGHPIPPSHHFWSPETHFRGPFLHISHRLKVTTKTKLADGWIEYFGHHRDCWTKVMLLMSSWSLGLSIDMWFVNFGRRLVSFPFLGCFG